MMWIGAHFSAISLRLKTADCRPNDVVLTATWSVGYIHPIANYPFAFIQSKSP